MTAISATTAWSNRPAWKTFFSQVLVLARANLKTRYRKTWAGFIWVVASPLIMYGAQSIVFTRVLNIDIDRYPIFLLSGLLPWHYIVQSLEMSSSIFVTSGPLLKSFPAHPSVYLLSQLADNFFNFIAAFMILFVYLSFADPPGIYALLLPIPLVILMVFVFALSWLLATMHVFFRDTRFIVTFVMNISFFLTPIFYSPRLVPEQYRWMLSFNPFHIMIRPFRTVMYSFTWNEFLVMTLQSILLTAVLLGIAFVFWRKKKNALYFNV